jgi:hypothetical protein
MSNDEFLKALWLEVGPTEEAFDKLKNEVRGNDQMCLVIFCEGLANFSNFTIMRSDNGLLHEITSTVSSVSANQWADNLISLVEAGDGT